MSTPKITKIIIIGTWLLKTKEILTSVVEYDSYIQ